MRTVRLEEGQCSLCGLPHNGRVKVEVGAGGEERRICHYCRVAPYQTKTLDDRGEHSKGYWLTFCILALLALFILSFLAYRGVSS